MGLVEDLSDVASSPASDSPSPSSSPSDSLPDSLSSSLHSSLPSVEELLEKAVTAIGGQERTGQQQMATAVDRAMATGKHLAVQAGTGTGKSLAYLVPALRHAVETGHTVVVSTATIALQHQLCRRDLPLLVDALAEDLGRRPTFALLKGRNNYLCLNALDAGNDPDTDDEGTTALIPSEKGLQAQRIHEWALNTDTGDRDDLKPGVSDVVWKTFSVDTQSCIGSSLCTFSAECFAEQARQQAYQADIVVTNHAMLAIDAASPINLLPDHDVVIIDEAHELESRVTNVIAGTLSATGLEMLGKRLIHYAGEEDVDNFQDTIEHTITAMENSPIGRWDSLTDQQTAALTVLRSSASALLTSIGPVQEADILSNPKKATAKKQTIGNLNQIVDVCDVVMASSPTHVVWMSHDERRGYEIHVAPLSVSAVLRDHLFADSTVILTSATLQAGGSFQTMARQWGLSSQSQDSDTSATASSPASASPTAPAPASTTSTWESLDVGSPFDHRSSGILYVAADLPRPAQGTTSPATLQRMEDLINAAGGRTLVLCSSRRAADEVASYLDDHVSYPVLCQGQATMSSLITDFAEQEESCLVGTLGLWQGVDVPGPSCSLVIIDRIPFPRPDDPLMSARLDFINEHGGNGFMSVSASHAALLLAQGTGRLLRSSTDRGVIAVMDSRLVTARYGSYLRKSLPPYWETTNTEVVLNSLRRITGSLH